MKYDLITSTKTKKFIKKLKDKELKSKFHRAFKEIQQSPQEAGELKKGDLAGVFGYDIFHSGVAYEIAYRLEEDEDGNIVLVILAGTREQFYEELKRYIKSSD